MPNIGKPFMMKLIAAKKRFYNPLFAFELKQTTKKNGSLSAAVFFVYIFQHAILFNNTLYPQHNAVLHLWGQAYRRHILG
jgi:hypothetical protein